MGWAAEAAASAAGFSGFCAELWPNPATDANSNTKITKRNTEYLTLSLPKQTLPQLLRVRRG
jgi:hypothetical protein